MNVHLQNTRARVRLVSFLTAGILVLAGFAIQGRMQANRYRRLLDKTYEYAFAQLTTSVSGLDAALQKGVYATSPTLLSSLCTDAFSQALSAQTALGSLPYGNVELEQTAAFLAKTGDYAMALSRCAGQGLSGEQRETLRALSGQASSLSQTLHALETDLYAGTVSLEDLDEAQSRLSQATEDGAPNTAGSSFQEIEHEFPELPTLIYDGPFSDHIADRSPRMLEGAEAVSRDEARARAAAFFGLSPALFTPESDGAGRIPTWSFSAAVDGGTLWVEVTKQGGQVLEVLSDRPLGPAVLSRERAVSKARDFLSRNGYPDLTETYFIDQGNALTINFAPEENGVLCYPDLIKVTVALDSGSIIGLEAGNYLMNHQQRQPAAPAVSLSNAQTMVTDGLRVLSHRLAIIPTSGENEVLCHEFKCENDDGQHYILYVNGQTGVQERILILLEDENGTLVL